MCTWTTFGAICGMNTLIPGDKRATERGYLLPVMCLQILLFYLCVCDIYDVIGNIRLQYHDSTPDTKITHLLTKRHMINKIKSFRVKKKGMFWLIYINSRKGLSWFFVPA